MIRYAEKEDVLEIRKLWDLAFGEDADFNEYFFENIFNYKNVLLIEENGEIMAMTQLIPYEIEGFGKVSYVYGATTKSEFRSKGYMGKLLKKSFELDIEKGNVASILIPASESLFGYYKKLGYETKFYNGKEVYKKGESLTDCLEATVEDIQRLNDIYVGGIKRDYKYWQEQIKMYNSLGGKIFIYKSCYAVVSNKVEEIMYKNREDRNVVLDFVCRYLKVDFVEVTGVGNSNAIGMMKNHSKKDFEKMYMGLMFN